MGESVQPSAAAISRRFEPAIPVDQIARNPRNHRKHFDQAGLVELMQSIQANGLLQPIVVRTADVVDTVDQRACRYEIIMGERRWRACAMAQIKEIPAMVYADVPAEQAMALALIENLQREQLNSMEEAEGFGDLASLGYSQQRIADEVHKSRARISNVLRLLELPEGVKDHVRAGLLTQKHAEGLLRFKDWPHLLVAIADLAVRKGASAAELAKGVPFLVDLEKAKHVLRLDYDDFDGTGLDFDDAKLLKDLKALKWTRVEKGPNTWDSDDVVVLDVQAWEAWLAERKTAYQERIGRQAEALAKKHAKEVEKLKPAAAAPVSGANETKDKPKPKLIDIGDLSHGSYIYISEVPAAIRKRIPADKIELGLAGWSSTHHNQGDVVQFTREVGLVRGVMNAAKAKTNKVVRGKLDVAIECAEETIKGIKSIRAEDLDLIAEYVVGDYRGIRGEAWDVLGLSPTDELHKLEPLQIIQLLLIERLRREYDEKRRFAGGVTDNIEAYAGNYLKKFEARQEAEARAKTEKEAAKGKPVAGKKPGPAASSKKPAKKKVVTAKAKKSAKASAGAEKAAAK